MPELKEEDEDEYILENIKYYNKIQFPHPNVQENIDKQLKPLFEKYECDMIEKLIDTVQNCRKHLRNNKLNNRVINVKIVNNIPENISDQIRCLTDHEIIKHFLLNVTHEILAKFENCYILNVENTNKVKDYAYKPELPKVIGNQLDFMKKDTINRISTKNKSPNNQLHIIKKGMSHVFPTPPVSPVNILVNNQSGVFSDNYVNPPDNFDLELDLLLDIKTPDISRSNSPINFSENCDSDSSEEEDSYCNEKININSQIKKC